MNFRRLLQTQMLHAAGDALVAISLADSLFFSVPIGQARDRVALYLLLTMTPFAVVAPVIGPLLDRWRGAYRFGVIASAAGRAVLAFLMATRTHSLTLYPLAFASLVLSRAHGVSRTALVPECLPEDKTLMWANARLSIVSIVAGMAAGLPGAGIQKLLGPSWTLHLAAIVFLVAAFWAIGLPRSSRPAGEPARARGSATLRPHLIAAGAAMTALRVGIGFLTFFLTFELRRSGHGARGVGLVVLAAALGGLAGSVAGAPMRAQAKRWFLTVALVVVAATMFVLASGFGLPSAAFAVGIIGAAVAFGRLAFDSLMQRDAPEDIRARTFARYETIFQLGWVGGALLGILVPLGGGNGLRIAGAIALGGIVFAARAARKPMPSA